MKLKLETNIKLSMKIQKNKKLMKIFNKKLHQKVITKYYYNRK